MIIVDTGSSDRTREIAARYTDRVYDFQWIDDFAAARNFSLDRAQGDWILVLDADELITDKDLARIRALIEVAPCSAYFFQQYNYSNNPLKKGWQPVTQRTTYTGEYAGYRINPICRLFRNGKNIRYAGAIHEVVDESLQAGDFAIIDVALHHHMDSDPSKPEEYRQLKYLDILEKNLEQNSSGRNLSIAGAVCIYHKHDYAKAIEYFQRAADMGYDVESNLEGVAEARYRSGDLSGAYATYQELYRRGYRTVALYINFANLKVRRGEFSAAVGLLGAALAMGNLDSGVEQMLKRNISYLKKKIDVS